MPGGQGEGRREKDAPASPQRTSPISPLPREVKFSNLDKIFWPDEKYTKGALIEYYRSMSPWLLPYLKDRPVVLTRYPDGINGKSFYQKDAPGFVPDWIQTIPIWSEDTQRDIQYFVANDIETDQRLDVVGDEVLDVALRVLAPDRNRLNPIGHEPWRVFLIERFAVDAVGIPRQDNGPVFQ